MTPILSYVRNAYFHKLCLFLFLAFFQITLANPSLVIAGDCVRKLGFSSDIPEWGYHRRCWGDPYGNDDDDEYNDGCDTDDDDTRRALVVVVAGVIDFRAISKIKAVPPAIVLNNSSRPVAWNGSIDFWFFKNSDEG